jgi:hypothetical protein
MNYSEHRYKSKDGLSLYYREYGSGEKVIICPPGLTRNSKDFHDLATCLVLRGEISDLLSEDIVKRMRAVKPDLKSAVIPNRGHVPLLEEPESLSAIDSFHKNLECVNS